MQGSGISNVRHYVVVSRLESLASDALQTADLSVSYFQLIQVLKYSGDHSLAESPKTTQQCDDRHDSRPKAPAWHGRWQLSSTAMPAVRTLKRMDLVFRDNWPNRWEVRDLMAFGIRVVTAEFRTAITARPGAMMYHPVTRFRRNQTASPLHMSSLASAFAIGFWLRCAHGLLPRSVARRWQRRIARVHSKSALDFFEPSHQHQKTGACRRTALVPRLLRNTVWFDQRSFAHTRRMSEFTNSGKTSSVNGYLESDALSPSPCRSSPLLVQLGARPPWPE